MVTSRIKATGAYAPAQIITNDDLARVIDTSDEWIRSRTGICSRHLSSGENTAEIAAKAGMQILERSKVAAEEIDLLIVGTITPDYLTPSVACMVQKELGLTNAVAFDVTAACSGFMYALSIADKYIRSGVYRNAIVIGAEVLSKIIDWTDRSTCCLFGDGAGGVYIEASEDAGILCEEMGSDGFSYEALIGGLVPPSNRFNDVPALSAMQFVEMDGRAVFKFATKTVSHSILQVLEKAGVKAGEVAHIIPHQANSRIVEIIAKKTMIPLEKFYLNLDHFANTSSATIPLALNEMNEKGMLKAGEKILMTGFGGGLTWGTVLLTW